MSNATIRLASHYYSSERQKLKVQPNKINMQNRKQMGSEHTCIYHAFKTVGTYQSIQSSKQSFRIEGPYSI